MFSSVKEKENIDFQQKGIKSDFGFSSQCWEVRKAQLWVLSQHHTSQFATRVKETVRKVEQQIPCTDRDLSVEKL